MYSQQIEKAIQAAAVLHANQTRKGVVPIPYVSHVFSVFLITTDYTDDEDTLVAALLHDTIEDTDYTEAALVEDFGEQVASIVRAVSEDKAITDWSERKDVYLQRVVAGGEAALLISAADKIHNMRSMIEQYHTDTAGYVNDFARYATKGMHFLDRLGATLEQELENDIVAEYQHVLTKFKDFNEYVQEETANQ